MRNKLLAGGVCVRVCVGVGVDVGVFWGRFLFFFFVVVLF